MKSIVITGIAALTLATGFIAGSVVSDNKTAYANVVEAKFNSDTHGAADFVQITRETAGEATELSVEDLEKLGVYKFNLPATDYKAYVAEKISITDTVTVITLKNGIGFPLKKGDIVRINSINKDNTPENHLFTVGYVKDSVYTSTTCGNTKSPVTAWEILEDEDAGNYEIYIKGDSIGMDGIVFDFIITVERPQH